jgi:hypothetical protein
MFTEAFAGACQRQDLVGEVRADRQTIQHSKTMFSSSTQRLPNESSDLKA